MLLEERLCGAHVRGAFHLAGDNHGVERPPAIMCDPHAVDGDAARFFIYFELDHMRRERVRR